MWLTSLLLKTPRCRDAAYIMTNSLSPGRKPAQMAKLRLKSEHLSFGGPHLPSALHSLLNSFRSLPEGFWDSLQNYRKSGMCWFSVNNPASTLCPHEETQRERERDNQCPAVSMDPCSKILAVAWFKIIEQSKIHLSTRYSTDTAKPWLHTQWLCW